MTRTAGSTTDDPALSEMVLDILEEVFQRASGPGDLPAYLTEKLRGLTGARCVVLLDDQLGAGRTALAAASPASVGEQSAPPALDRLFRLAQGIGETRVWHPGDGDEASEVLGGLGYGLSVTVPLAVGTSRVGSLLLLELPEERRLAAGLELLKALSTVVALALQNAALHRQQEQAIHQQTRDLRAANQVLRRTQLSVDRSNDAVFWVDRDGTYLYVNDAACRLTDYSREELLASNVHEVSPGQTPERWAAHWAELGKRGTLTYESVFRNRGGRLVPVEVTVIHGESEGREWHCTFARDISDRKAKEREIERHSRLYAALSQINQAVVRLESQQEFFDRVCRALMELGPFPLVWIGWLDEETGAVLPVASCGDETGLLDKLRIVVQDRPGGRGPTGRALRQNTPCVCADFSVDPEAFPWRDDVLKLGFRSAGAFPIRLAGEVRASLSVYSRELDCFGEKEVALLEETAADISFALDHLESESRRRKAEEELKYHSRVSQILLDSMPCIAILMRPGTREIVAANRAAREVGAHPGAVCFETWGKSIEPCPWCLAPALWESGQARHAEVEGLGIVWDAHWVPVAEDLYLHYAFDITERKRIEVERMELEKQLRHAQKMEAIGTLAGGIAHDFNNILTPILAHADLALLHLPQEAPARDDLESLLQATERAAALVKQILAISRKDERSPVSLSLAPLLKEAMKLLRASLPSTVEIREEIDPESPTVLADPSRVHQIVLNLVANARDAMGPDGGLLTVSLGRAAGGVEALGGRSPPPDAFRGAYARLAVSDTGCGIPLDALDRVFEPYFTTKPPGKGTGLGLAVVQGIVKNMGGKVRVRSEVGRGTTFEVLLPECAEPGEPDPRPALRMVRPAGPGLRVLFVDDEPAIVRVAERMLRMLGHEVRAVARSETALELLRADPTGFDLLISDQTMPGMTGVELVSAVRVARPDLPVILCTGYSETLDARRAREAGANALVMKPFTRASLAAAIEEVAPDCAKPPPALRRGGGNA